MIPINQNRMIIINLINDNDANEQTNDLFIPHSIKLKFIIFQTLRKKRHSFTLLSTERSANDTEFQISPIAKTDHIITPNRKNDQ